MLRVLVGRDLKVVYKRSFLGLGWALGMPLVQLIVFSFVFRKVLEIEVEHYSVFVFVGVLVWGWFHSSLGDSVGLITSNRVLVGQPGFPLAVLPNVTVLVRLFHFLIALPLLVGMIFWSGLLPNVSWCFVPLLLIVQYLFTVGIAYPLASMNVIHRDTQHVTRVLLQLMMFLTPVFYSLDRVPEELQYWFQFNPMVGILDAWRSVLIKGTTPDLAVLGRLSVVGLVLLFLGRRLFVQQSHQFIEEL
ncbi:MAG: ABC transporter permease [Haloferula sp.]|uniref:ABC transporter permease n=1 Tax=Haloferula sp. TaxID=2497595 RepID=UPI00329A9BCC